MMVGDINFPDLDTVVDFPMCYVKRYAHLRCHSRPTHCRNLSNRQHILYSFDSIKVCSSDAFIVYLPFSEVHLIITVTREVALC